MGIHKPVMLKECLDIVLHEKPNVWADLTLGSGGHTSEVLRELREKAIPLDLVFLSDADPRAIELFKKEKLSAIREYLGPNTELIIENLWLSEAISKLREFLAEERFLRKNVVIMVDLGISLDQVEFREGFGYKHDTPLDMRFNPTQGVPASELIGSLSIDHLSDILKNYGEIRHPYKLARAIKSAHSRGRLRTTGDLVKVLKANVPEVILKKTLHKVFQALRIAVNDELGDLKRFTEKLRDLELDMQITLLALTYHSLERRVIKPLRSKWRLLKKLRPTEEEIKENPSSRSAILYIFRYSPLGKTCR